jgi:membrane-bound lytic murein transglycosylase A
MTAGWPHIHLRTGLVAAGAIIALGLALGLVANARAEAPRTVKFSNTQLEPVAWTGLDGWAADDHMAAFVTFLASCKPILRGTAAMRAARPVYGALYDVCRRAVEAKPKDANAARAFFEQSFRPVRISPLGEADGFFTGYYEPVVDGSREPNEAFTEPLYRKPSNLLKGGRMLKAASFSHSKGKKGKTRHAKRHRLVPFHERAAIEEGVLNGRKLEICYLKDPIDSFFIHIQGSARVRLEDGKMLRVNYEAQNGHPYTAVGRFLIERKIVSREEMSMDRIRQWMAANPEEGKELRRLNKSYVFFRETGLADNEEAIGAQGVSLTPGRSIAVDRNLHVYGTPFFIQAELPIESEQPTTKFRRLMVAQDTGGAIVGVARADIYFGAGDEAGRASGRLKHPGKFVMFFPNEIDPVAAYSNVPLPTPRPAIPVAEKATDKPPEKKAETKAPEAKNSEADKSGIKASQPKASETKKPDAKTKSERKKTTKPKRET